MPERQNVSIVRASETDAASVASLVHRLLSELGGGSGPSIDELTATTHRLLAEQLVHAVLAMADEQPVGVLCLNECAAIYAGGRFGEITELYVVPECRSSGVAPILVEEAKRIGRERGWSRLEVGAPDQPAWDRTLQFYLREGFAEVGPRLKTLL